MKTSLLILLFVFSATPSFAMGRSAPDAPPPEAPPAPPAPPAPTAAPSSSSEAYAKLQNFYNSASLASVGDLPTQSADVRAWNCAITRSTDAQPETGYVPTLVNAYILDSAATPAVPSQGPLFPAIPAMPERSHVQLAILYSTVDTDGEVKVVMNGGEQIISLEDPKTIGKALATWSYQALSYSPDLSQTFEMTSEGYDQGSATVTVRTKNGMLAYMLTAANQASTYGYCWKKGSSSQL